MYDIVVIGGGAAGMFASAIASDRGARVLLLERGKSLGNKLRLTGKGRCNLTNDCPVSEALSNVTTGREFLQSAMNAFSPRDCIDFFQSLGLSLKTERGNRVFPSSDSSSEVVSVLRRFVEKSGVEVLHSTATGVLADNGQVVGVATSTAGDIDCRSAVIATGGLSYPATGSTGDGYGFARALGHTINPLKASLVPIEAEPEICSRMQGLTLRNIRLSVYNGSRKLVFEDFGELLFTHFGLSGPLALSASAHLRDFDSQEYYCIIDMKPGLNEDSLDKRILRDFEKYSNRDFSNALGDLLNRLAIPVVIEKSGIDPEKKVHSITRSERMKILELIKGFRVDIDGLRPIEEAVVTSGGVHLKEINPKTMESKLVKGLYFAGEVIDADAYTGGFNLQIAWSTAYVAGTAAAKLV